MERKSGTGSSAGNSWQTVCQMAIKNDYMWFVCVCKCVTSADVCCGMWECVDKVYNVKSSESCNCWEFIIKLETRLWIDYAGAKLWGIKKLEKVTFRHVFSCLCLCLELASFCFKLWPRQSDALENSSRHWEWPNSAAEVVFVAGDGVFCFSSLINWPHD